MNACLKATRRYCPRDSYRTLQRFKARHSTYFTFHSLHDNWRIMEKLFYSIRKKLERSAANLDLSINKAKIK